MERRDRLIWALNVLQQFLRVGNVIAAVLFVTTLMASFPVLL